MTARHSVRQPRDASPAGMPGADERHALLPAGRLRILMVSPVPTHPTTAGNRARIRTLAEALRADEHELHFAFIRFEPADTAAMRESFGSARFHCLDYHPPRTVTGLGNRAWRKGLRLLGREGGYLWRLDDWYDPGLQPQLAALHAAHRFDCVFAEYVFISKALEAFPASVLKILDTHDRFALRHRAYLGAGQTPQWFSTSPEEESAGLRRADVTLAIQEQEADEFRRALGADASRVVTVGHLLDLGPPVQPAAAPKAVFLASSNPINVDAARHLIAEVLPLVRARHPGFAVVLAGEVCGGVPDAPHVEKLGRVDRVADAFARAAVAVNPVRIATGINVKLLETLAAGLPNISSASGARGLDRPADALLVVPDGDAGAMANAIDSLLADPARAAALAAAGRRLAEAWNARQLDALRAAVRGYAVAARPAGTGPGAELSVVFCTRNRPHDLRAAVASVLRNHAELHRSTAKLWIIDDGSLPEELVRDIGDRAARCGWTFAYANKSEDPGLLRSRVRSKNLIRSGWILFLDDDIEMQPGYLARLEQLAAVPEVAGVGGVDLLGKRQSGPRRLYEYLIGFRALRRGRLSISGFGGDMDRWISEKAPFESEFLYGCNMAFRADALRSLEAHAAFESYSVGEDMLLSSVARRHGRLIVDPQMRVKHFQSPLARDRAEQISYMQVVNHYHLLEAIHAGRARKLAVLVTAFGLAALSAGKIVADLVRGKRPELGRLRGNCRGLGWLAGALLSHPRRLSSAPPK